MIDFLLRPFRRNFGPDKRFYAAIDDMFGFIPNNIELYKLALIHKSASVAISDGQYINNERLEFLGDAVIESVTSDYLFIEFPDKNEGFLTQLRSKMVSRQTLNGVAKSIGLDEYVITNTLSGTSQKHIYGDAFEAMMGAIYLDQGYDFVNRLLINKIFVNYLKLDTLLESETDFKSRLIEWCQKNHHTIQFVTTHDKSYSSSHPYFYAKVLIDGIEAGYGVGESKKEAEQRASYSVSQGFSDDDCTKLLDKLDSMDHYLKEKSGNRGGESAQKRAEKAEDKPLEKSAPEKKLKPEKSVTEKEPEKELKPEKKVADKKIEKKVEKEPVQEPENMAAEAVVDSVSEGASSGENVVAEKPKTRKPRRRKVVKEESAGEPLAAEQQSAEVVTAEIAEPETNTSKIVAEKPKRVVRRRKKSVTNEESA